MASTRISNILQSTTVLVAATLATGASAQSTANLIFAVDESGSMPNEQTYLGNFASEIDTALTGAGFGTINFGLTGFGNGIGGNQSPDDLGRVINVGGALFGNAADFATATDDLVTDGGFEDGYSAIDFILKTYPITAGTSTTLVLVTDEDRDDGNSALTFSSISSELNARGINLISVVEADLVDDQGNTAIASDGTTAFIQDGNGFTTAPFGSVTGDAGSTEEDYIQLAFSTPNGCTASLNELRKGGQTATAFSAVLLECLTTAAVGGGGGMAVPLNQYRSSTKVVMEHHRAQTRRIAFGPGASFDPDAPEVTQNAQVAEDMFTMDGLRGYAMVSAYSGDFDAYRNNVGLDYDGYGIIVGADHTREVGTGTARFGASLGYGEIDADEDNSLSSLSTDSTTLQFYAAYSRPDGLYTQGNVQLAWHDFTNRRVAGGTTFVGTPDGETYGAEVEVGYRNEPMPLGKDPASTALFHLTPFGALGYEYHSVDGYTETNGGVTVASFDEDTLYGRLGVRAMIERFHEGNRFYSAIEVAGTGFFSGTNQGVRINNGAAIAPISSRDDVRLDIRLEAGAELNETSKIFVHVDGGFADHSTQYAATAGLELKF
ncbi:autotransporter domain-containing protein [Roseovarius tibetensis]|uniref:autotransporter outer membrane beta-barrel domain-containing protein n=1 Tax=Roseovarius tibetensis TaxID=2685897 RepID=UPI003D7FF6E4